MIRVGVTGGIGSGKSTACEIFAEMGVAVYDCDREAKRLMTESAAVRDQIIETFGNEAYAEGELNRAYLAEKVFGSEEQLARLNAIVHPAVREDFRAWCAQHGQEAYVLMESAILFDAGFESEVDVTLAVVAPRELRTMRVCNRNGLTPEQVEERMAHQMSDDELHARANYTMVNISLDYLRSDVEAMDKILRREASRR
ncbi:MAG: dephospho-CoA kinase [Alistipes sp.]|nr:dephospho-CoA kinase [Alistipes sp.]